MAFEEEPAFVPQRKGLLRDARQRRILMDQQPAPAGQRPGGPAKLSLNGEVKLRELKVQHATAREGKVADDDVLKDSDPNRLHVPDDVVDIPAQIVGNASDIPI